ncbi:uncharacterized protein [Pagrus major]|uniref:uncharacterized protein n=1 Tax=Pagrus major TaxID=143350 RepID=UPI003CC8751E
MSSVECLRDFVSERLTAAAEEIFGVFIKTIVEYEEEIDRQRRLLDVVLKPQIKLHRIELPQQHDCMEEEKVLSDQQLCEQERNSSLDQEDSDPPQIKEEQRDLSTSQEGEQLVLKLETDTFVLTPTYKESDHSEPESKSDHQLLSENWHVAESQDQKGGMYGDSRPTTNTEPEPKKTHPKSRSQGIDVFRSNLSEIDQNMHTSEKKQCSCEACGKVFKYKSRLHMHMKSHTGERPYPCNTCGKRFAWTKDLRKHVRIHTGEKPYPCNTCGKRFAWTKDLRKHVRIHTDKKPYTCTTCSRDFKRSSNLVDHMRTHTGEKPYICKTCGRAFARSTQVTVHMRRAHTGEKPYLCKICGKRYFEKSVLTTHMSVKHKVLKTTMSSVECLRDFVSERLTAAAEEIFGVFIKTIVEYEEEIDRQRRLLDVVLNPQIKLHRIELPQQHDCMEEEEVLSDQQLCDQERNSSLDQEDSDPPQIKEEQRDLGTSQEGEQLVLKLETDTCVLTPTYKESDHSEPELESDHQLLFENWHVAESQDQKGGMYGDSRSMINTEPEPKKAHPRVPSQGIDVSKSDLSEIDHNTHTSEGKQFSCEACGKVFKFKSRLHMHMKTHTGEKPYPCNTCGKRFARTEDLKKHVRIHTGEKPYSCTMCGRDFRFSSSLLVHMRTHTGEKPFICKTCGRAFVCNAQLTVHTRRAHTGEKPYVCKICGMRYFEKTVLTRHSLIHENKNMGEEPLIRHSLIHEIKHTGGEPSS